MMILNRSIDPWKVPIIMVGLILCLFADVEAGGAWGRQKGTYFAHLGFYYLNHNEFYNSQGREETLSTYFRQAVSLYGEYGIRDRITAVWKWPFYSHKFKDGASNTGIGDVEAELHFLLWKKWIPTAVGIGLGIPLGEVGRSDSLDTGDGELDYSAMIFARRKIGPLPLNVSGSGKIQMRTEGYTSNYFYDASLSYKFKSETGLSLVWRTQRTLGNPDVTKMNPYLGFGEGVEYDSQGFQISQPFMGTLFTAGYYTHFIGEAKNIIKQPYFIVGMGLSF